MNKDLNKSKEQLAIELYELRNNSNKREEKLQAVNRQLEVNIQKLRTSQQELKQSEEIYHSLSKNMQDVIVKIDKKGMISFVNKSVINFSGYLPEEVIGTHISKYMSNKADMLRAAKVIAKVLITKRAGNFKFEFKPKNKEPFIVEHRYMPIIIEHKVSEIMMVLRDDRKQKQAENALKNSEEYYRTLIENSIDAISVFDANGNNLFQSESTKKNLGYEIDARIGKSLFSILHPDDKDRIMKQFTAAIPKHGIIEKINFRAYSKDGTLRYLEGTAKNMLHSPAIKGIVFNYRDVSERIKQEQKLENENKRFLATMDAIDVGLYVVDMQTYEVLFINKYFTDLVGERTGEKCYKVIQGLNEPCDFCTNHLLLDENNNPKEPYVWEHKNRITNRWYQLRDQAIRWTNGKYVRLEIATDITESKKAEDLLVKSEKKHRDLFEKSKEAILIIQNGEFTDCNQSTVSMLNYQSKKEFLQTHPSELSPERQPDGKISFIKANEMMEIALEKGSHRFEWDHQRSGGEVFPAEVLLTAISNDKNNQVIHTVWRDITERKKAEEELKANEKQLKEQVKFIEFTNCIAADFINIKNLDTKKPINRLLEQTAKYNTLERAYVFLLSEDEEKLILAHDWCEPNVQHRKGVLDTVNIADFKDFTETLRANQNVSLNISDLDNSPENKAMLDNLNLLEIKSFINLPMLSEGKLIGYIGFDSTKKEIAWTEKMIDSFVICKEIITNVIEFGKSNLEIRKLSQFVKTTDQSIVIAEMDGTIVFINEALIKLGGYDSHEEVVGTSMFNFFDSKGTEKLHQEIIPTLLKEGTYYGELLMIKKDNSTFASEMRCSLISDDFGKPEYLVLTFTDISERINANKEISKLSTAVEQSDISIVITDTNGNIEYTNHQFTELTGYTADEARGKNPRLLNAGTQAKEYYAEMWETIKSGKTWNGEFHNKKKNGELFWETVSINPIKETGKIVNFLAIKKDITKLKKINKELVSAKEQAQQSDRLKSAFLLNMSHEIRTPMNGILGSTELLKEPDLTGGEMEEYLELIEKCGDRMLNTINDIVDISKIEAGMVKVSITEVSINEMLAELSTFFNDEAELKRLSFASLPTLPDKEAIVLTDSNKLNGILTNLIKNAIKFTMNGGIIFGYLLKADNLEFYVKDTGVGVSKDRQDAIFNHFEKADIEDTMVFEGSGLGLAISKEYVNMLGGKLWIKSKEGEGSTFRFTIPYKTTAIETNEKNQQIAKKPVKKNLKDLTVLVAEDEQINIKFFEIIFKNTFRRTIYVITGQQVVDACRDNPETDLVLMDRRCIQI